MSRAGMRCRSRPLEHPNMMGYLRAYGHRQAKINLLGAAGVPELIWVDGMSRREIRRAMRLVTEQQAFLLARWRDLHERSD